MRVPSSRAVCRTTALLEQSSTISSTPATNASRASSAAAARTSRRVTLELGGKSPVSSSMPAPTSRWPRRDALGQFVNAGQTCCAPRPRVRAREVLRTPFVAAMRRRLLEFTVMNPAQSPDYCRIATERHAQRFAEMLVGRTSPSAFASMLRDGTSSRRSCLIRGRFALMQEEIFVPVLPVHDGLRASRMCSVRLSERPKPLACTCFRSQRGPRARKSSRGSRPAASASRRDDLPGVTELPFGGIAQAAWGATRAVRFRDLQPPEAVMRRSFRFRGRGPSLSAVQERKARWLKLIR